MKPYQFQYQKILDLKQKEVETAKINYANALKNLDEAKLILDQLKNEEIRLHQMLTSSRATTTYHLCNDYQYLTKVKEKKESQIVVVRELEKHVLIKHKELLQTHQEEKKWSKLSEIQKEEYLATESKKEQEVLHEISLQKYIVKK